MYLFTIKCSVMTSKSSFKILFFLRKRFDETGRNHIYARITVNGTRSEFGTKQYVYEDCWNSTTGCPNLSSDDLRQLNFVLKSIHSKLMADFNQHMFNNIPVTAENLKNRFLGIIEEKDKVKHITLLELFDIHNEEMKNILAWGTLKNYFTTKKYFQAYIQKVLKQKDVELCSLSFRFISAFESFMRKELTSIDPERPCENNTIMKHIERFRKIINL